MVRDASRTPRRTAVSITIQLSLMKIGPLSATSTQPKPIEQFEPIVTSPRVALAIRTLSGGRHICPALSDLSPSKRHSTKPRNCIPCYSVPKGKSENLSIISYRSKRSDPPRRTNQMVSGYSAFRSFKLDCNTCWRIARPSGRWPRVPSMRVDAHHRGRAYRRSERAVSHSLIAPDQARDAECAPA
jgi:hypothetical protein